MLSVEPIDNLGPIVQYRNNRYRGIRYAIDGELLAGKVFSLEKFLRGFIFIAMTKKINLLHLIDLVAMNLANK